MSGKRLRMPLLLKGPVTDAMATIAISEGSGSRPSSDRIAIRISDVEATR
jgi:hypothetical protein